MRCPRCVCCHEAGGRKSLCGSLFVPCVCSWSQVVLPEGSYGASVVMPFDLDYEGKEVGLRQNEWDETQG